MSASPTITNIFSHWKLVISNCILAVAMVGSMYGILQHYDGRRLPDWDVPISLNTLIALITMIFRTSLVCVLAEIIGQAKWQYFVGNGREDPPMRRLIEASRFNDASQGLFGAMKLIPKIIGYPDVLLAVTVMVVSLGTGSFVQQAIQTQPCQYSTDSVNASLPISRNITFDAASGGKSHSVTMAAAISSALAPDNDEIGSPISVGCSTGNCTFQNSIGGLYNTLGVCSSCTDTSSLITSTKWTETDFDLNATNFLGNYTLPIGLSIRARSQNVSSGVFSQDAGLSVSSVRPLNTGNPDWTGLSNLTASSNWTDLWNWTGDLDWAGDLVSPEMRALSQWAFANVTVFTSNWIPTSYGYSDYLAVTCTLYPCLRTYSNASVIMGRLDESLVNTVPLAPNVNVNVGDGDVNYTTEDILTAPSWFNWNEMILLDLSTPLQAVQSPCLVDNTVWTEDNTSSTIEKQRLLLLRADPGPDRTRHIKIENITAPTQCIYSMDLDLWRALIMDSMIRNMFNGSCSVSSFPLVSSGDINCNKSYWLSRFYDDNGITTSDIINRFETFADRLSNKLRMGLLGNPEHIFGQTLQTTICVDIDYRWLTFPTALVLITSGLLMWTIFRSWRRQRCEYVWKTSILPFLFYSERFVVQNGEDVSAESTTSNSKRRDAAKEALMDLDQMEIEAKQQLVRFDVFN